MAFHPQSLTPILVPLIIGALNADGKRHGKVSAGRTRLTFGPGMIAMAIAFAAITAAGLFLISHALFTRPSGTGTYSGMVLIFVIGITLSAFGLWMLSKVRAQRFAFDQAGIYRQIGDKELVRLWSDVFTLIEQPWSGPLLSFKDGLRWNVWRYLRGFGDLTDAAKAKGVPVKLIEQRK